MFPEETKPSRKRKSSHNEECGASYLTPAAAQSSITLSAHVEDSGWNVNLNNSNSFLKSFMSLRNSKVGSVSRSPTSSLSPIPFDWKSDTEGSMLLKVSSRESPKIGRPQSKSSVDKPGKRWPDRSRSCSREQSAPPTQLPGADSINPLSPASPTQVDFHLNSNSNNSSPYFYPTQMLSIPYASFRPLPITPPRNPFEDMGKNLNPKTLKQLQRH